MSQTTELMDKSAPLFVAGDRGMAGAAILRCLQAQGYKSLVTVPRTALDLREQGEVRQFFRQQRITAVVLAAGKVGGIHANNTYPADFLLDNLLIEANVIQAAHAAGVQRLLVLNATAQAETLDDVAQAYGTHRGRSAPLAGTIITKTDEAARTGCALDVVIRRRLPLNFICNGQRVPEDLSTVNAAELARTALRSGAAGTASKVFSLNDDESGLVVSMPSPAAGIHA